MKTKILLLSFLISFSFIQLGCNNDAEKETKCCDKMEKEKMEKKSEKTRVAVLVTEGFHDGEAYMPIGYLTNRGIRVCVIGPEVGEVKAYNSDFTIKIQKAVSDVSIDHYDALILPGGKAPAILRQNEEVVAFVKDFFETGKTTAGICHGPQVLIDAGIMEGKTCTAFWDVEEELVEAGATFLDKPLVIDGNLITSRVPKDLHDFSQAIYKAIK